MTRLLTAPWRSASTFFIAACLVVTPLQAGAVVKQITATFTLTRAAFYVERRPGTLHFEIPPDEVAEMIRPERLRQYSGNVTVIWDSDI
ncbi:hypothetical protein DJ564_26505 [Pseudomonas sp. 31-12]|uniref:hypothetical protein n=1 Tax=Pseudomonas sp. 31-12 TaxID=2201356 RepID=UPI000D6CFF22|nr:hypothetical protein [Pseudomonas sp. 31-12]AWM94079.1 hypothetical protein DJ564_26505 [Pseudomonas sp. 31-12]